MTLTHEILTKKHLPDLRKLIDSFQKEFPKSMKLRPHEFIKQLEGHMEGSDEDYVLQYMDKFGERVPTGFISLTGDIEPEVAHANMVYVLPAVRSKGHGEKLTESAKELLGYKKIEGFAAGKYALHSRKLLK